MWKILQALTVDLFSIPRSKVNGEDNPDYFHQTHIWRLKIVTLILTLTAITAFHSVDVYVLENYAPATDVQDIKATALEQRMDKWYTALCMDPGEPQLLELIRELQDRYTEVRGHRYSPPTCDLLLRVR